MVVAAVQVFFLLLLNFAAHPFALMQGALPADGAGLNPLLQYPEMVIHPPMLYLGYVGFTVPFAFALGALAMRYPGEKWIHITRRWTMVTWGFLTCGVFLGMHWAYSVLGWGGYWGWDPVENASLMPWLTGTAFLHSVMMQEKRGMLKTWNMWLIFATFWLSILGTFLTRSGFSQLGACLCAIFHRRLVHVVSADYRWCTFTCSSIKNPSHLRSEHKLESLISRESSFLFNNLLLLLACFTVLWGTLFPKLSELVQGNKVTVGAPFFNTRRDSGCPASAVAHGSRPAAGLAQNFVREPEAQLSVARAGCACGRDSAGRVWRSKPWKDISYFYSLMAIMLSALVALTVISEFIRGGRVISRHTGQNLLASMVHLLASQHPPLRRVHRALWCDRRRDRILRLAFNQDKENEMGFGDQMTIGPYTLVCRSYTQDDNPNYASEWAIIDVFKGGKQIDNHVSRAPLLQSQPAAADDVPPNRSTL